MKIDIEVPDGKSGDWEIKTRVVEEPDPLQKARAALRSYGRITPAGTYKVLYRNGEVIMSNTPDEINDFQWFILQAKGDILVNGLGLGVVLKALIDKPEVRTVTVIELSEDVISLVAPTYRDNPKVKIIQGDAFTYQPPKEQKFDAVWHDIWDIISAENIPEMIKLHRKYGKKASYQASWCRPLCEEMYKEQKREEEYYNFLRPSLINPFD